MLDRCIEPQKLELIRGKKVSTEVLIVGEYRKGINISIKNETIKNKEGEEITVIYADIGVIREIEGMCCVGRHEEECSNKSMKFYEYEDFKKVFQEDRNNVRDIIIESHLDDQIIDLDFSFDNKSISNINLSLIFGNFSVEGTEHIHTLSLHNTSIIETLEFNCDQVVIYESWISEISLTSKAHFKVNCRDYFPGLKNASSITAVINEPGWKSSIFLNSIDVTYNKVNSMIKVTENTELLIINTQSDIFMALRSNINCTVNVKNSNVTFYLDNLIE